MLGILPGDEENHWLATQHDALVLIGHANDGIGAHDSPPLIKCSPRKHLVSVTRLRRKVVNPFPKIC
jgi:hypothetical protein